MWNKVRKIICLALLVVLTISFMSEVILAAGITSEDSKEDVVTSTGEETSEETKREEEGASQDDEAVGKVDKSQWVTLKDYDLVAESESYRMYLYSPRLSIILENKETGEIIESTLSDEKDDGTSNKTWNGYMKSGLVINAIIGTTNTYQVDLLTTENTIELSYTDNGFSAQVYFPSYGFGLTVNVALEGNELVVGVPSESIVENTEGTYISTISLYPFMGYTYMDEEDGYMLIPDGNGALIYLDDKEGRFNSGFSQPIYGNDIGFVDSGITRLLWDMYDTVRKPNDVIAPVFGMIHSNKEIGYLGIVEEGDKRASIEAHPNGATVNYNRIFAKFMIRDIFVQPLNNSNTGTVTSVERNRTDMDMQVRYILVDGDSADYAGLAVEYRNYLLENNLVELKDTSYNTRVDFLGADREEWLIFKKAVTMTTTDNIKEIYSELEDEGIESLISVYKGWQKGGLYDLPIKKYKADKSIGGTKDLTDLIKEAEEKDYNLYLYNDALRINPAETNSTFNVVKRVNKRTYIEKVYKEVYKEFEFLTPARTNKLLSNFVSSYTDEGVDNLAIAGISNNLFSYSYQSNYYTRYDSGDDYTGLISSMYEKTDLLLEQPYSYLWNYTDGFLDMPLSSSSYMTVDEEVPFLSMVLKGIIPMYSEYVNFEANQKEYFLRMVEAGVYPSFYITYENSSALVYTNSADLYSSEYSAYKDTIVEYDREFRKLASLLDGAYIVDHEKGDDGVTRVTYDNGIAIYVNYTDSDASVDGMKIPAMSYKIGDAR